MPQTQEVRASLGCGTLILIAIIVIIFSGNKDHDDLVNKIDSLSRDMQDLRQEISQLRNALQTQPLETSP